MEKYFNTTEYDKLIHFQMPKVLMYGEKYKTLSPDAKMLYMVLFDLTKVSMQNHGRKDKNGNRMIWKDDKGFFIKCSIKTIEKIMNCANKKAGNLKKQLEKFNLLKQKTVGQGKANLLYVMQLEYNEDDIYIVNDIEDELHSYDYEREIKNAQNQSQSEKCQNDIPRSVEMTFLEVSKSHTSNNKYINNQQNNNKYNPNPNLDDEPKKDNENQSQEKQDNKKIDLDLLWQLKIPMQLKQKIKVKVYNNEISLTDNQLLQIESAYNYQKTKYNVVPEISFDDPEALNDSEFSESVMAMLQQVKDIQNMKGLIKKYVSLAIAKKYDLYGVQSNIDGESNKLSDFIQALNDEK